MPKLIAKGLLVASVLPTVLLGCSTRNRGVPKPDLSGVFFVGPERRVISAEEVWDAARRYVETTPIAFDFRNVETNISPASASDGLPQDVVAKVWIGHGGMGEQSLYLFVNIEGRVVKQDIRIAVCGTTARPLPER